MAQALAADGNVIRLRGFDGVARRLRHLSGATALLIAASAHAQSGACEQLRRSLAERLPGDPRSYTLDVVPSGTPLPRGGKFIGNCEGGAKKILYRRGAAAEPASSPGAPVPAEDAPLPHRVLTPSPAPLAADAASAIVAAGGASEPGLRTGALQQTPVSEPSPATISWWSGAAGFAARYWPWVLTLLLVPIAWVAWAWWSHHRAYDAAGLPRGPRLTRR